MTQLYVVEYNHDKTRGLRELIYKLFLPQFLPQLLGKKKIYVCFRFVVILTSG